MGVLQRIKNWFTPQATIIDEAHARSLRLDFQSRYHQFKLLINANNQALQTMTEVGMTLAGDTPFGMAFVRSRSTALVTRVYQIVKHLHALAPGKYQALTPRLAEIHQDLARIVNPPAPADKPGPFIRHMTDVDPSYRHEIGMKMASLGEIASRHHLRIPDGFVITASAFQHFLDANDLAAEIQRRIQVAEGKDTHQLYAISAKIRNLIQAATLPSELHAAILKAVDELAARIGHERFRLAVRSSALNEDLEGAAFAGLYQSALNIYPDQVADTYKQIVATAYSPAAMAYRFSRGMVDEATRMCVGVMQMVDAVSSGVLYSANPLDEQDPTVIINSVWGLPTAVVDGTTATDLFHVSKGPVPAVTFRHVAEKEKKYICSADEGVIRLDLDMPTRSAASLTDHQAIDLAALATTVENSDGRPRDIEWAIDPSGAIIILQCRPLQMTPDMPAAIDTRMHGINLPPALISGGITASPGVAAGSVHQVCKEVDALRFPEGAVLVTDRALSRWAALLPKAVAVISEKGSLTGHLANVARELGVPALFGVPHAVGMIANGTQVTVDSNSRHIYPGSVTVLMEMDRGRSVNAPMQATPVYAMLKSAAKLITPLNLLDPDSPTFSASNCRTLHDITRFCHEKSVHEMFRFGKTHRFPERSSKQLRARIPMQWWILNLDDGFINDVGAEPYVDIDNIASIPMRALWEGITAFPWEGPPPVDGRGFAAVMFRATQNQALLPTVPSSMANRNYFMISKNYCSLQSRLGFHFAITEALVSGRTTENYVTYQFKGGAADFNRRLKRVRLVAGLLEHYGFSTEITRDALRARMDRFDAETMAAKLKILGYLTIHTRQLDMIMANPKMAEHYRCKMVDHIDMLLEQTSWHPAIKESVNLQTRDASRP